MRYLVLLFALLLAAAGEAPSIKIDHPWSRPTTEGVKNGAVFFTLTDQGEPDRLIGASTPVAAKAEVHETTNDNGVMKMRAVNSVTLTPGKSVAFAPGGLHVMLMGLTKPLTQGATFPLTLMFDHTPPVTVNVTVEGGMGNASGSGTMSGMDGMSGMGGKHNH